MKPIHLMIPFGLATTLVGASSAQEPAAPPSFVATAAWSSGGSAIRQLEIVKPARPSGPERVLAGDDSGRCVVLKRAGSRWTERVVLAGPAQYGAWVLGKFDPSAPCGEVYGCGKDGRIDRAVIDTDPKSAAESIVAGRGSAFTHLLAGDFDSSHGGDELLALDAEGKVFEVIPNPSGAKGFELDERGNLGAIPTAAVVIPATSKAPARVAVGLETGEVSILGFGLDAFERRNISEESSPIACLACTHDDSDVAGLYVARADGVLLHLRDGDLNDASGWSREMIYAGPSGPRVLAAGRFDDDQSVETVVVAGESRKVQLLTWRNRDDIAVETIFETSSERVAITTAEVDGRNTTEELLVADGSDVVVLARVPGYGLVGVAADPDAGRLPGAHASAGAMVSQGTTAKTAPSGARAKASVFADGLKTGDALFAGTFEQDAVGADPMGFKVEETAGTGKFASWKVLATDDAADGHNVVRIVKNENTGATFNLLLSDREYPADARIDVAIRPESGKEDQGGGLVWRAKDASNYYVTRWNPLESNLRVYKVENGVRSLFQSSVVQSDPTTWHRLTVVMRGAKGAVAFDGAACLEFTDTTFSSPGRVGFWTKADAATSFDGLAVRAPDD